MATLALLFLAGCGDTGQDRVTFPVHGAGTGEASFEADDGWTVTLERADVALGPIYFCATPFADLDVCPRAEAELLEVGAVDALDETPQMLGTAEAITGTSRSAMMDYGIGWLLPEPRPRAFDGAPRGHSAVFRVVATREDATLTVDAAVDIAPRNAGANAVIGVPTGTHDITGEESLTVRLDPAAWWARVGFEALAATDEDMDGAVTLAPGDRAYEALVIAMTSGTLPTFEWAD
ncbi:MAG TPA: hypothetical protein RMH99_30220 [Sandaracinaceae bacterium LLY-WYZ-13_1]|nr:hypothetical protein [Sandaracinaceae bacterium LLY-WYZ-13_1]